MTTYTVTMNNASIDYSFTWINQTAAQVKAIKATYKNTKGAKVTATKEIKAYYRGTAIIIHEEVQNGYTLASAVDGSFNSRHCNTKEIEYR